MPRSTFSAVLTPDSDSPSSTSVIATAGPHADDDRVGVEDARDGGDVVQHAADEAVDDLQRRDVDQHALGAVRDDLAGQIFLQRGRQPVVHVDLDGDEQRAAEFQNRNAVHRQRFLRTGDLRLFGTPAAS